MNIPNERDFELTEDGDILIYSHQESEAIAYNYIKEIGSRELVIQNVKTRIKTTKPDWFFDHIGANVEEIIGMENSKDTALYGAELIKNALTENGYIKNEDIFIKPVPANTFSIIYLVAIRLDEEDVIQLKVNVALNAGINVEEMI